MSILRRCRPGAADGIRSVDDMSTPTQTDELAGKTVAFIATNGFEDSELTAPGRR
jgi:hypothetical protein